MAKRFNSITTWQHDQITEEIREMLKGRLSKLGSVKTEDAWEVCKGKFNYSTVACRFRLIMQEKRRAGEADFIHNGLWFIHKNKTSHVQNQEVRF